MSAGGEEAKEVLRVRPLLPLAGDRDLARRVAEVAERHYPPGWIRRSNERSVVRATSTFAGEGVTLVIVLFVAMVVSGTGPLFSFGAAVIGAAGIVAWLRKLGAGWYRRRGSGLICLGGLEGDEKDANIVHELGHRMQDVIPGLVERERAFLERKLGRRVRRYPRAIAAVFLMTRPFGAYALQAVGGQRDESRGFFHPYAALDRLDGKSYEVFTMGFQGLLYGAKDPKTGEFEPGLKPHGDHRELVERALREL